MGSTQGNILVIRGGAIGDFILTLPVLSALRQHFPRVRLEILGYPHIAHLALAGRLADHVRSIEAARWPASSPGTAPWMTRTNITSGHSTSSFRILMTWIKFFRRTSSAASKPR